ncbi:MAG: MBL fold metallo-hydrolase [Chloroflexi bacterium]|nr:MBL fold metallo-hydrolase [Chloroflexota bacterium]
MTEIRPGIYQLKIPIPNNPLENTNIYLLRGTDGYFLIDAGWSDDNAFQALQKQLAEIGVNPTNISQIIVTHAHRDHYGLVGRLKQVSPAKVSLHQQDVAVLTPRFRDIDEVVRQTDLWFQAAGVPASELPNTQAALAGMGRPLSQTLPDISLNDGETISTGIFNLQVIWTPGHAPGHVCLYEPDRKILFSGDHILPVITPNVSLQPNSKNNPLGDFVNSLELVKRLDATLVLPAHENIFTNLQVRVDEIIEHHEYRNSEIINAIGDETRTAYEIAQKITWMPEFGGVRFRDLALWDKRSAVSETLAHLEAMRVDAKIEKIPRDSVIYYRRT